MKLLAIDPGYEQSAIVHLKAGRVAVSQTVANADLLRWLDLYPALSTPLVIEQIEGYGMAVGKEVFETVYWSGRFHQAWKGPVHRLPRRAVKLHLCGSAKAKDANVRQALLDRFGPGKEKAIGSKRQPGPCYGVKADQWAALAVAVTWMESQKAIMGGIGDVVGAVPTADGPSVQNFGEASNAGTDLEGCSGKLSAAGGNGPLSATSQRDASPEATRPQKHQWPGYVVGDLEEDGA